MGVPDSPDLLQADFYFAQIPEWVLYAPITAVAVRLYCVLHRYADKEGKAFPSRKTLAGRMGLKSPKSIDAALKELVAVGAVTFEHRLNDKGDQTSNLYTVRFAPPLGVGKETSLGREEIFPGGREGNFPGGREENDPLIIAILNHSHLESEKSVADRQYMDLCNLFADLIEANDYKRPTVTATWLKDMRLLHVKDERPIENIEKAIRWVTADPFWRKNVLSPGKLRERYDRLRDEATQRSHSKLPAAAGAIDQFLKETR